MLLSFFQGIDTAGEAGNLPRSIAGVDYAFCCCLVDNRNSIAKGRAGLIKILFIQGGQHPFDSTPQMTLHAAVTNSSYFVLSISL